MRLALDFSSAVAVYVGLLSKLVVHLFFLPLKIFSFLLSPIITLNLNLRCTDHVTLYVRLEVEMRESISI